MKAAQYFGEPAGITLLRTWLLEIQSSMTSVLKHPNLRLAEAERVELAPLLVLQVLVETPCTKPI
jgi:hypothetical protein